MQFWPSFGGRELFGYPLYPRILCFASIACVSGVPGARLIENASLVHKDLHGNDLVPTPYFQSFLNVVS
jgi:hypothetical protein